MSIPPRATTSPRNTTVAFIEDDRAVRIGVMMLLESLGHKVVAGRTGAEVASQVAEMGVLPTLVIADYRLGPRTTAVEEVPEVTAVLPSDVEVIVTTGDTSPEVRTVIEQCGWHLLIKPYRPDELLSLIEGHAKGWSRPSGDEDRKWP